MRAVEIDYLAARVHQLKRKRLQIAAAADDVVLLVLGHVQNLLAEAVGLSVDLLAHGMLAARP